MQRIVAIITLSLSGAVLYGEETAASEILADQSSEGDGFFSAIFGPGMWPLWICSVLLIAFILERRKSLKREKVLDRNMIDTFTDHVSKHDIDAALNVAKQSETVVGKAWSQGVEEFKLGGVSIQDALTDKTVLAFKPLKRNLQAISTIGVISPLMGLFGTVAGMIITFQQIAATGGADKAELSSGIALALFTTAGGLIVAIPAIIGGRYFNSRLTGLAEEVEDDIHRVNYRYNAYLASEEHEIAKATTAKRAADVGEAAAEEATA